MFDPYAARWVGKHSVERIQGQLPPVLCLQHSLDRPQRGAVRAQGEGMGNQRLFCRIRHKAAVLADPEPERHLATQ